MFALSETFVGKDIAMKIIANGLAIVQALRLRVVISPSPLGVAPQKHHHYTSKFLIDTLNSLGFCSSWKYNSSK